MSGLAGDMVSAMDNLDADWNPVIKMTARPVEVNGLQDLTMNDRCYCCGVFQFKMGAKCNRRSGLFAKSFGTSKHKPSSTNFNESPKALDLVDLTARLSHQLERMKRM